MNNPFRTFIAVLALSLAACQSPAQVARDLTLKVSDDTGRILVGAQATITFVDIRSKEHAHNGLTDANGEFGARTEMTIQTYLQAALPGHYPALVRNSDYYKIPTGRATVPVVLPRVLRPTALHALRVTLNLSVKDQWLGYDLQAADFVPPQGKGKTTDLRFKFKNEFVGFDEGFRNIDKEREFVRGIKAKRGEIFSEDEFRLFAGKWRGSLEVSFPGEKEGVITEAERYWFFGQLRLPHLAPEAGYAPSLVYEANTYEPRPVPKRVGYFLRTRVKLDADRNIISANYAKIYDDIHFDARGTVSFWYYYNPTPNDRNLEFDPSRNLFPQSMPGANIANP
jgi:hypothetical protein